MHQPQHHLISRIQAHILIAVTVCYITGALLARFMGIMNSRVTGAFTIALITAFLVLLIFHRCRNTLLLVLPLFVGTGFVHTANSLRPPDDPTHLFNQLTQRTRATLTGRVVAMPWYNGKTTRFDLDADAILLHNEQQEKRTMTMQPARGKIRLSYDGALPPDIEAGSEVMVLALAGRTYSYRTPGVFDYRLHLAERNIYVSGKIESPLAIQVFHEVSPPWHTKIRFLPEQLRQHIDSFLVSRLDRETAGIYRALLIGNRAGINDVVLEQFRATGCMHLLAISGIHMSLLGLITTFALTWIMKRSSWLLLHTHIPTVATLLSLAPLTLYAFIAGMNTPVLRSLLMSAFFLIGVVLQRQRSILYIIAGAALLLLLFKPLALFTVSFQLSFASILAIALIYPNLHSRLEKNNAEVLSGSRIWAYISSAILVSLAASIGALPFMLLHFNRFSLIGPVMNLLVEPFLCLWALPLGLLSIPLLFLAPEAATLLLQLGKSGITAADWITQAGSIIPFASLWTITPSLLEISLFCLLAVLWIRQGRSARSKIFLTTSSIALVLSFTHGLWLSLPSATAELSFLDVGQGTSTFIRMPQGHTILIDGGSRTSPSFDIGERVIAPFLRKKRVWRLDDIIITHPHSDHANGIAFILRHFKPRRLWLNGDESVDWPYSAVLRLATQLGTSLIIPETGGILDLGHDARLTFIRGADSPKAGESINDRSLVIRLDHKKKSFLFPGDIGTEVEKKLVGKGAKLEADLLLAPHHGSRGSGSKTFITAVDPGIIVISAGHNSQQKYIDAGHIAQWRNQGRTVLTTSASGTIICLSNGNDLRLKTVAGLPGLDKTDLRPR